MMTPLLDVEYMYRRSMLVIVVEQVHPQRCLWLGHVLCVHLPVMPAARQCAVKVLCYASSRRALALLVPHCWLPSSICISYIMWHMLTRMGEVRYHGAWWYGAHAAAKDCGSCGTLVRSLPRQVPLTGANGPVHIGLPSLGRKHVQEARRRISVF